LTVLIAQPLHEARKVKKYKIIMEISKKLECVLLILIAGSDRHSKMVGHAAAPAGGCTHGQQRRDHVFVSDGVGGGGGGGVGGGSIMPCSAHRAPDAATVFAPDSAACRHAATRWSVSRQ
jgi:hypothetical protein